VSWPFPDDLLAAVFAAAGDFEPVAWVRAVNAALNVVQLVALAYLVQRYRRDR
jgi:hypothetical protein